MKTMPQQRQEIQQTTTSNNSNTVVCRKCRSTQVVANKRGYSFLRMFLWLGIMLGGTVVFFMIGEFLASIKKVDMITGIPEIMFLLWFFSVPVAIIAGFVGRNAIVNGCMNCGHKWMPVKKK